MKKRGMVGQVFIYIFVVIVIAFIFLFGFNMIKKLNNLNEQTVYLTFKNDFKKNVDDLYYKNVGSVMVFSSSSRNKPLMLPKGIDEVCFEEGKVKVDSEYADFNVEKLTVVSDFCVEILNNQLPFILENVFINGETYIQVSAVE